MKERNHTKAIVIVHGKSEHDIVRHIRSKLRIPIEIYSRDKGKISIEISSLNDILKNSDFLTIKGFLNKFPKVELDNKGIPKNVKIFMIMDVDSTSLADFNAYKNKSLFPKTWLKDKLVPIWNDNNLEEVLEQIGYYYAKSNKEKKGYKKVFPVERGSQDLKSVEELRYKLQSSPKSNMDVFLTFCLDNCPRF